MSYNSTYTDKNGNTLYSIPACIEFVSVQFGLQFNTQTSDSPFTRSEQTNELPGARWAASFELPDYDQECLDCNCYGELKAFLARLRGRAGRFFAFDPTHIEPCGSLGKSYSVESTCCYPANDSGGLYPSDTGNASPTVIGGLYPSDTGNATPTETGGLYPYGELPNAPANCITLTYTFAVDADNLTLSSGISAGATTLVMAGLDVAENLTITESNPYDQSNGANPLYEQALADCYADIAGKIPAGLSDRLLLAGDHMQIGDELKIVVSDVDSDGVVEFEPPMRDSYPAGTAIVVNYPGCIMRLTTDDAPNWTAINRRGRNYHTSYQIGFEGVEVINNGV